MDGAGTDRDSATVAELRERLREYLDHVRASARPLLVTRDGRTDAVALSAKAHDALVEQGEWAAVAEIVGRARPGTRCRHGNKR